MDKKDVQSRVLQHGKPLGLDKFNWDRESNTFSSNEYNLVLDFRGVQDCTFTTGCGCTFTTGYRCTFKTGSRCTFKTGSRCTFRTDYDCTFDTDYGCIFKTGSGCNFKTGSGCTFDTDSGCNFKTGSGCTFDTWRFGYFNTSENNNSVLVLRGPQTKKIIDLEEFEKGKLIRFSIDHEPEIQNEEFEIIIDGKVIKISKESYTEFKKQFI